AEATADNIGKQIAIIYDDTVVSSPTVQDTISDGNAQITGMSSFEEADELASMIRIGALNLELNEIRSTVVGAKLGSQAISSSLIAGAIGLAIVCVLMMIVYLVPGIVASLSLIIYTLLILLVLNAFDITMSLSGIAGIVLSIGMAVDANVIIYARIREEIAAGRPVKSAVKIGFQKALSAIVDGNVTTLIAAAILMWRGTGMVRGFAQTLAIGIVLSMFTALVVTRLIMYALVALGMTKESYYGRAKTHKTIPFLEKKAVCFLIPIVIFVIGIASMAIQHFNGNQIFNYSLEFVGGTSTTVTFNEDMSIEELDAQVAPVIEEVTGDSNIQMQKIADSTQVVIKTRELSLEERSAMNSALEDNFDVDTEEITAESISSTVSNEMKWNAIVSVIIAGICMLIYIWFRFSDVRFAASAVLALLHDVLIVLAFYAVFRVSVGSTFIACILTIVGYSINATIVIFDRIRENLKNEGSKADLKELVNRSITQTLTRSIYTSLTTFIMIVVLFILGVSSIREFAAPLMVGIVAGAYSSVCLTGAIWFILRKRLSKKTSD
ncbi:MAG: protein translocase subunit SecD, partial [Lachnospiraceae bacterium]